MPVFEVRTNRELLFEYFLTFSRFEYALKASGFFKPSRPRRNHPTLPHQAEPDWARFALLVRDKFQPERTYELKSACEYLLRSPPMKQVVINGAVAWETPLRPIQESEPQFLLRMVKCVRNNLFHGGKYSIEVHENTQRTEMLLRSSIVILEECLALAPEVKREFDEATI